MPVTVRYDDEGRYSWDRIERRFDDNGVLVERLTVFDSGIRKYEEFENGVRKSQSLVDNPEDPSASVRSWSSIDMNYDEAGQLAERLTTFDNGVRRYESFENGVKVAVEYVDDPFSSAKPWESITITHDEDGNIGTKLTVYDNGVSRYDDYEGGIRSRTEQVDYDSAGGDGAKPWSSIVTEYDAEGAVSSRVIEYDDGITQYDTYVAGVRSTSERLDNPVNPTGVGVKTWTSIETLFDEFGNIDVRTTYNDNGTVVFEKFTDGYREYRYTQEELYPDGSNLFAWTARVEFYDPSGAVTLRGVQYDTLDEKVSYFEDGRLTKVEEYDGDGSEDWLGRTTTFDQDGGVISDEFYFAFVDYPEDFMAGRLTELPPSLTDALA